MRPTFSAGQGYQDAYDVLRALWERRSGKGELACGMSSAVSVQVTCVSSSSVWIVASVGLYDNWTVEVKSFSTKFIDVEGV